MALLTGNLTTILDQPAAGFRVTAELTHTDWETGKVTLKGSQTVIADDSGAFEIDLEPNAGKTQSSQYRVKVQEPTGAMRAVWTTTITVPDVATVDITTIIDEPPYPAVDAAQLAVQQAQAAAALAGEALTEVNNAADAAITAIGDEQTAAVQAVNDARDSGITEINDARESGVTAVNDARDAAITTINGLVQDAQDAAGLSEAWATGTEPGGEGTKSSREHAEDSAASATEAEEFKNDAETAANRIPDPTGQPEGLVPQTDGAGANVLVPRFGSEDLRDPNNLYATIVAPLALPGIRVGSEFFQESRIHFYGPPRAPLSGQSTADPFGEFDFVFPVSTHSLSATEATNDLLSIAFSYNCIGGGALVYVGFGVDEDNYYYVGLSRQSSLTGVWQVVDGVHSKIQTLVAFSRQFQASAVRIAAGGDNLSIEGPAISGPPLIPLATPDFDLRDITFIGFGEDAISGPRDQAIFHAVVTGVLLESMP